MAKPGLHDTPAGAAVGGPGRLARLGTGARTDLLLFSGLSAARRAGRALRRGLRGGELDMARFGRSVERVLALREELASRTRPVEAGSAPG